VTGDVPVILRPGLITKEMIAAVVGACEEYTPNVEKGEKVKSPGVLYKHYAPKCKTMLYTNAQKAVALETYREKIAQNKKVAVLCEHTVAEEFINAKAMVLDLGNTEQEMASRLYGLLRDAEKCCDELLVIEPRKQDGVMVGVLNRLSKACVSVDIPHEKND
jgi:L-threonylcarbamoyladenylate synthase